MSTKLDLVVVEQIIKQVIEQVPALALFVFVVWMFLKQTRERDKLFLSTLEGVKDEMSALAEVMSSLAKTVATSQTQSCDFHDDFTKLLREIHEICVGSGK